MDAAFLVPILGTLLASLGVLVSLFASARRRTVELMAWQDRMREMDLAFDDALRHADVTARFRVRGSTGDPDLEAEVEEAMRDLNERIKAVEDRFPDSSTIDKVASVNDAVLATKLELVEKEVERLRGDTLTRWDVALVVFSIIGAMGVVLGMVVGALNLL